MALHARYGGLWAYEPGLVPWFHAADVRADLLAVVAGILEGTSEGEFDEPLVRQAAALCRKAGADPEAIPGWIEEGRRRRAAADMPPFSGGLHGG